MTNSIRILGTALLVLVPPSPGGDAQQASSTSSGAAHGLASNRQPPPIQILAEADYLDRLRAMWLAQCLANWTGRVTEGERTSAPFFTDADWGTVQGDPAQNGGLIDFVLQTPWGADDDTDIEYMYLDAMTTHARAELTAAEIQAEWLDHILPNGFIWGSNLAAHNLMRALPPALPGTTSFWAANKSSLNISTQLTELFGAVAPGDPVRALELAQLPILTTASGYATHAAQFHVALYSLALVVDRGLSATEQNLWLVDTARQLLPAGSKASDVIDFVLQQYAAIPDPDDWELARDAIYDRYQDNDTANGFLYLHWYESPINLATSVMALLFGEGDYRRTIQIGTLSGWDSDNGTATMGGLLGLLQGSQVIEGAFPNDVLSDYYDILGTRINFQPPFCEAWHPNCLDRFTAMAQRMWPRVVEEVVGAGGSYAPGVSGATGTLTLPTIDYQALDWCDNPLAPRHATSGSNQLRAFGYSPSPSLTGATALVVGPSGGIDEVCDGLEFDFSGVDRQIELSAGPHWVALELEPGATEIELSITWPTWVYAEGVRFVEGPRAFSQGGFTYGSGLTSVAVDVRVGATWIPVVDPPTTSPSLGFVFEIIEWPLAQPEPVTGVRLRGVPIGNGLATVSELEVIVP